MAIRDLKSVIYTADNGREYATKMDASVFAQVGASSARKVGGADYTGAPALPPMPRTLKPRVANVSIAGSKRRVVCLTPTSELYVGTETAIDLPVLGAAAATFSSYGNTPEARPIKHDPNQ